MYVNGLFDSDIAPFTSLSVLGSYLLKTLTSMIKQSQRKSLLNIPEKLFIYVLLYTCQCQEKGKNSLEQEIEPDESWRILQWLWD